MSKNIILSTGNINDKYKVKGIVHIEAKVNEEKLEGGWANFKVAEAYTNMNKHFITAAENLKGNGVINIKYTTLTLPNFDFKVIGSGTVIEIIE